MYKVPIAVIIFNRPQIVKQMYDVLQKIQPQKLYIISDAARKNIPGELEKVAESRRIFEHVDWECQACTNYADENMGCDPRIKSGLDWLFSLEKEAIVLEDDCIPDLTFFEYCEELLDKYREDDRVSYIAGSNQIRQYPIEDTSYIFAYDAWTLGWATWARAWEEQTDLLQHFAEAKKKIWNLKKLSYSERYHMVKTLKIYKEKGFFPWDMNFTWSMLLKDKLSIVPKTNLIDHVGFTEEATHVKQPFAGYDGTQIPLKFPLVHPIAVEEKQGYHKTAYNWNRETILQKLCSIDFYKRQIRKIWKSSQL